MPYLSRITSLGKVTGITQDEFREDFYSSPTMANMSWEERQLYRQGHRTLQVFSNFEDVIEFAHQYRERAISRFERMAGEAILYRPRRCSKI